MSKLSLDELIGNRNIKAQLKIAYGASRIHNRPLGHILLAGSAGCGKTTCSKAVADLGDCYFKQISGDSIKSPDDLTGVFEKFPDEGYDKQTGKVVGEIKPPILFIDEIHQLSLRAQEILGMVMESFLHTYTVNKGRNKHIYTTWVPRFTVIGATTREGSLSKPFRDRFKHVFFFAPYSFGESIEIVKLHASKVKVDIDEASLAAIAKRGRGVPRTIVRYLERMIDSMTFLGRQKITEDLVEAQFSLMKIDKDGLTESDIIILKDLYTSQGPVGLEALALKTNQDPKTVVEVNEPHLMRLGLIERGPRGRILTERGVNYLISTGHIEDPEQTIRGNSRVIGHIKKDIRR